MLSSAHRDIIRDTVPMLETGGETLARHFYQLMFEQYPHVKALFNPAHQARGDQPRALANAVLMYARNIDRLEALGPLVTQIVQKHVALQILPEHYPIVGTCLLTSIRQVLGEQVATDEVLDAWAAAYAQLADILIGAEEGEYARLAQAHGGWRGGRLFRLARRVEESTHITSFYFVPVDGKPVVPALPGQYIGLRVMLEGEARRNYSLSAPSGDGGYRISVKREPGGRVSNYLHDHLAVGDTLELFPPAGAFVLQPGTGPVALISAGVGITPMLPMMQAALAQGRTVYFIHCARDALTQAFGPWLQAQAGQHPGQLFYYRVHGQGNQCDACGRLDGELLRRWLPGGNELDAYFLGPEAFMADVKDWLAELGVPAARCHWEFFGPAKALQQC
ncbi:MULTISPECIES: NO-inducible flavohemoprotein [unclassified Pseudomonas]|uniref:NO-inducible flavohemoprotein n=1 Tax=unclassified Pseudomonas TaxID=196821 RepID=UPI000BD745D2|nr:MULTISPECIES: NO-inducible flavohemoprotein [unclassified Pseudomonas]PVZ11213.1 nitric oxide dioxygenase [Pseudomonas sp. URIL14HWK12:I12]PVZ22211.1 nitric oxide dioxygenase [Pseudomonas sp. URIL14HWK12:I10]PVZ31665.1 nitric oxide dioxygenase [Pseudomonas sp. URIL14HWK12:I11]SNZ16742.1 nitric oxide dioxygenase [Pseudomonas sp. URIL14HWK12:I9]